MRKLLMAPALCGGVFLVPCLFAGAQQLLTPTAADNVNSRYVVESVEFVGDPVQSLPAGMRFSVQKLIGERFNAEELEGLARQLRRELHLHAVTPHLMRGSTPDQVKIAFEVERRSVEFDLSVPKFLYSSDQGWSTQVNASTTIRHNTVGFGIVSDGDEEVERYSGITARYENARLASDRIRFRFLFESYHEEWNRASVRAAAVPSELYRARINLEPVVVISISRPLTLLVGASFEQMQFSPTAGGSQPTNEAANAVIASLRYDRRSEGSDNSQETRADYSVRAAMRMLGSGFAYNRHRVRVRYVFSKGRNLISDELTCGMIAGEAPLFERFVAGNGSLLRGWNRFEIDPLGGDRLAHNSVEYGYRVKEGVADVFYDSGAIWDHGQPAKVRQSLGLGYRKGVFSLALAFPLREGRVEPVVLVGMNY